MNPTMYEELFESLPDGIVVTDPEGRVIRINNQAGRLFGYAPDEITGQHHSKLYTPEDAALGKPGEHLRVARECGRCEDEGWRVRQDGSRFWASTVMTALRDASGELLGFSNLTRDFTEQRKAEESLLLEITNVLIS
ncbi:MAG: PAS domain-containing protein, partial [Terriglobia bacterium]